MVGALRAALAFQVKDAVGVEAIAARERQIAEFVFQELGSDSAIVVLGNPQT